MGCGASGFYDDWLVHGPRQAVQSPDDSPLINYKRRRDLVNQKKLAAISYEKQRRRASSAWMSQVSIGIVNMKRQNEWLKQLIGTPSRISKPQTLILPDLSSWPVEDEHLNKIMYGRCRSDIRLADDSLKGHAAGTPDRRPKSRVSVGRQSVSAARRSIISSQGDSVVKRLRFSQEIALQNQGFQPQLAKRNQKLNRNRAASVPQSTRHLQYTSPRHSYPTSPRLSTPHPPQQKGKQKIAAAAKTYSPKPRVLRPLHHAKIMISKRTEPCCPPIPPIATAGPRSVTPIQKAKAAKSKLTSFNGAIGDVSATGTMAIHFGAVIRSKAIFHQSFEPRGDYPVVSTHIIMNSNADVSIHGEVENKSSSRPASSLGSRLASRPESRPTSTARSAERSCASSGGGDADSRADSISPERIASPYADSARYTPGVISPTPEPGSLLHGEVQYTDAVPFETTCDLPPSEESFPWQSVCESDGDITSGAKVTKTAILMSIAEAITTSKSSPAKQKAPIELNTGKYSPVFEVEATHDHNVKCVHMLNRTGWTNHQALEITEFEDKEAPLAEIGEVGQETEVSSSFIVSESASGKRKEFKVDKTDSDWCYTSAEVHTTSPQHSVGTVEKAKLGLVVKEQEPLQNHAAMVSSAAKVEQFVKETQHTSSACLEAVQILECDPVLKINDGDEVKDEDQPYRYIKRDRAWKLKTQVGLEAAVRSYKFRDTTLPYIRNEGGVLLPVVPEEPFVIKNRIRHNVEDIAPSIKRGPKPTLEPSEANRPVYGPHPAPEQLQEDTEPVVYGPHPAPEQLPEDTEPVVYVPHPAPEQLPEDTEPVVYVPHPAPEQLPEDTEPVVDVGHPAPEQLPEDTEPVVYVGHPAPEQLPEDTEPVVYVGHPAPEQLPEDTEPVVDVGHPAPEQLPEDTEPVVYVGHPAPEQLPEDTEPVVYVGHPAPEQLPEDTEPVVYVGHPAPEQLPEDTEPVVYGPHSPNT